MLQLHRLSVTQTTDQVWTDQENEPTGPGVFLTILACVTFYYFYTNFFLLIFLLLFTCTILFLLLFTCTIYYFYYYFTRRSMSICSMLQCALLHVSFALYWKPIRQKRVWSYQKYSDNTCLQVRIFQADYFCCVPSLPVSCRVS